MIHSTKTSGLSDPNSLRDSRGRNHCPNSLVSEVSYVSLLGVSFVAANGTVRNKQQHQHHPAVGVGYTTTVADSNRRERINQDGGCLRDSLLFQFSLGKYKPYSVVAMLSANSLLRQSYRGLGLVRANANTRASPTNTAFRSLATTPRSAKTQNPDIDDDNILPVGSVYSIDSLLAKQWLLLSSSLHSIETNAKKSWTRNSQTICCFFLFRLLGRLSLTELPRFSFSRKSFAD